MSHNWTRRVIRATKPPCDGTLVRVQWHGTYLGGRVHVWTSIVLSLLKQIRCSTGSNTTYHPTLIYMSSSRKTKKTYHTTSFTLPGVVLNPLNEIKTALAIEFLHSRSTNPRNLEHHTYALWERIFEDLVADNAQLGIIPQHMLWYLPWDTDDDDDDEAAGDQSLESIAATVAQARTKYVLPDFAIIRYVYRLKEFGIPRRYKIQYIGVPALSEQKRPPKRRAIRDDKFYQNVVRRIWMAKVEVEDQAMHLFRMHKKQEQVLTFACTGTYWCYRIVRRGTLIDMGDEDDDDFINREEDVDSKATKDGDDPEVEYDSESEAEDGDEDEDVNISALVLATPSQHLEPIVTDDQLKLPTGWSKILEIDTPASNQHFSLISSYLNGINDNRTRG